VAAHSTVRALYGGYNGSLYQVRRASDNATMDVGVLSTGGYANAAAQDSFCAGMSCVITIIYDQSGRGNNLTQAPPGGFSGPAAGGYDNLAYATAAPITVNGHEAYGVYVVPGTGYRNDNTNGIATGDNPEGEYAVVDGTHYNHGCCFDYGNAEADAHDDGNGTMEALYFGKGDGTTNTDGGPGSGPWVRLCCKKEADLLKWTEKKKKEDPFMAESHPFKWRHFQSEIILLCVRWYLRYALSYRESSRDDG
jgi:hypothetical protein